VPRPRLLDALRGRFDRPLTVLVGGPGFGKTTVLAQSLLDNRLEALGTDVWLRIVERDRVAEHFAAGLARSITGVDAGVGSVEGVLDLIWSQAPEPVALVLDDVHLLGETGESVDVVARILDDLPRNGHLVLSGRSMPRLPLARMQSEGTAHVLRQADLAFSDDELATLADRLNAPDTVAGHLPHWPAMAVLTSRVGREASIDYLWEQILASMPVSRQRALAAVAPFGVVDDELVAAVLGASAWSAASLVAGLPLIESDATGSFRLHDLWGTALAGILTPAERRDSLRAGAAMLLQRGQHLRAAEAYAAAGDTADLVEVVRRFATQPLGAGMSTSHVALLHQLLPPDLRSGPIGQYLEAAALWASDERDALAAFEQVRASASAAGDRSLEATAWWRVAQFESQRPRPLADLPPRLAELAEEGWPLARSALALLRSVAAQMNGDARAALAELDGFDRRDPAQYQAAVNARMLALGRPEMVAATLESVLTAGSGDVFGAQAVWMRGEVSPELAWPVAVGLHDTYTDRRVVAVQVALDSIVCSVALTVGKTTEARRFAELALAGAPRAMPHMSLFAGVADAMVALVEHGEHEFEARIGKLTARSPLHPWPAWAYLSALAPIRALIPGAEVLDGLDLGPALRGAVDAGRAVAELRGSGEPGAAVALPWERLDLLRVHVPVPLLCELALAASADVPAAERALDRLPQCGRWIRRLTAHPSAAVRRAAEAAARVRPPRPDHHLRIATLGRFAVECPPGAELAGWDRRERVRSLVAELVVRRSASRDELAAALWPDLSEDKAANNLRVNLHHLQQLLEPRRPPDAPPAYLQPTATGLRLCPDDVTIDVDDFDARVADALAAERRGSPSHALEHYEAACALYRGDFLPGIESEAVVLERTRLRSVAHGVLCRRGELTLARGEPESALRLASAASQLEPFSERAGRLAIRCHLAIGSASAGRDAARLLALALQEAGIRPEPETSILLERVGL
jgi:DNA-binding SARP family transcriptional activator